MLRPCRLLIIPFLLATSAHAQVLTISAAVSLKEVMTDIGAAYQAAAGKKVQFNFAATGHLLAQIREGAPVDLFIAASDAQMSQADNLKLIDPASKTVIATNTLVLIVPADSKLPIAGFSDLTKPNVQRLAMGEPKTVPAGEYAIQTLKHLNLLNALKPRIISAANVRQVLDYVERGEVDAGIVYATDAAQSAGKVKVIATADESTHDPIRYPAAIVAATTHRDGAKQFLQFLTTDPAARLFQKRGFLAATQPASQPAAH